MNMPTEHTYLTYLFAELSEDAQAAALEEIARKLGGEWWDQYDTEAVGETIVYALAEALGSPGWDHFGEGDFPGIDNVKITGWDLDRGWRLDATGTLDRSNAPLLPWVDGFADVVLWSRLTGEKFSPRTSEYDEDVEALTTLERDLLVQACEDAFETALRAGERQMEYIGSEDNAREWIEANEPQFLDDGRLAP